MLSPVSCAALQKLEKKRNAMEERGVKVAKKCEKTSDPKEERILQRKVQVQGRLTDWW